MPHTQLKEEEDTTPYLEAIHEARERIKTRIKESVFQEATKNGLNKDFENLDGLKWSLVCKHMIARIKADPSYKKNNDLVTYEKLLRKLSMLLFGPGFSYIAGATAGLITFVIFPPATFFVGPLAGAGTALLIAAAHKRLHALGQKQKLVDNSDYAAILIDLLLITECKCRLKGEKENILGEAWSSVKKTGTLVKKGWKNLLASNKNDTESLISSSIDDHSIDGHSTADNIELTPPLNTNLNSLLTEETEAAASTSSNAPSNAGSSSSFTPSYGQ